MATRSKSAPRGKSGRKSRKSAPAQPIKRRLGGWLLRGIAIAFLAAVALVLLFRFVNPPTGIYMFSESRRLGGVERDWVPLEQMAPVMARAAVAAEDANFCNHWGFDMQAIRKAIEAGSERGASTISQQTVKNVYLWHGRSWVRKALEAGMTPLVETLWPKRRIIEVYLNVAEFDEGVFGVGAAAPHYFGVSAADLSQTQAARLAAILPDPKGRSASRPSNFTRERTAQIIDGAATIRADGRSACFES